MSATDSKSSLLRVEPEPVCPQCELDDVARDFNDLHRKLVSGDGLPPRPFWLQLGNSGYKITDENRDDLARGMLLCLDVRGHMGR